MMAGVAPRPKRYGVGDSQEDDMDLNTGDMVIFSGEGEGGTFERYYGARAPKAIRSRLSRERSGGDRWASAWISDESAEDKALPGVPVYVELDRDLDTTTGRMRALPPDMIRDNPAARLAAEKRGRSQTSAENGKLGGRPRSTTPTSKQISEAFDAVGLSYAKQIGNVYPYIKRGDIQSAFWTILAGSSERTKKQHEFKVALKAIRERDMSD